MTAPPTTLNLRAGCRQPAPRRGHAPAGSPHQDAKGILTNPLGRLGLAALVSIVSLGLAACGGSGRRTDAYQAATDEQTRCCEHLAGAPRDQCLGEIVRVDDPAVASSSANQRTYACIERHFACDATTGRATPDSNQQQLDCIQDLGE